MKLVVRTRSRSNRGADKVEVTDDGLVAIEKLAAAGNANVTIASALGTSASTLKQLRDRDLRVAEALERGRAKLADELTDILLQHARNGNVTAAIFLSKARLGWRDTGPSQETAIGPTININIPPPMSEQEFLKIVTVKPQPSSDTARSRP